MDRNLWRAPLTSKHAPRWPCPACKNGRLILVPKSLNQKETVASRESHQLDEFEPEWITYAFSAWVKCGDAKCAQECVIAGRGSVEPDYDPNDGSTIWDDRFSPMYMFPMPDVFSLPAKCPDDVRASLRASFRQMWSDQRSAANCVRTALEQLLDHLGIQRKKRRKDGSFTELTLHARVEIFGKARPALGAPLMALKWVGNSGSHGLDVSLGEMLDAYELLEHALDEVIGERSTRVAQLAKKMTRRHSSKRKKRSPLT